MAERGNLIRKLFKSNNNNAEIRRSGIRKKQRNKVQSKRRNINAKAQVIKALEPYKSTKVPKDFHVTKKRLTKPLRANFPSRDIFKEPLHQASEGFCKEELKYIHESRQTDENYNSFMDVSPVRSIANSSYVDSPSYAPPIKIVEVSKSDEDYGVDYYSRFHPKATSTVQQENATVKPNVVEVDCKDYDDFASRTTKGVLEELGTYLTLGYYADTKCFLQEVYKESCKRKLSEDHIERTNMENANLLLNEVKAETLRTVTLSPPLARARTRGSQMPLISHTQTNTSFNFMTPNLSPCSPKTIDLESSPEVFHTPAASLSMSLVVSPANMVTLNADELLKKCSNKGRNGSLDFDGNHQQRYTNSLNTTELRCSRAYCYNYTSHLPNAIPDTERYQYCVSEEGKPPVLHHDFSLLAYNDTSLALQIPLKYKHEDAFNFPCNHCRGRGIQMIPANPTHSGFTMKDCLKPTTPDIKYFPRKTYREDV